MTADIRNKECVLFIAMHPLPSWCLVDRLRLWLGESDSAIVIVDNSNH